MGLSLSRSGRGCEPGSGPARSTDGNIHAHCSGARYPRFAYVTLSEISKTASDSAVRGALLNPRRIQFADTVEALVDQKYRGSLAIPPCQPHQNREYVYRPAQRQKGASPPRKRVSYAVVLPGDRASYSLIRVYRGYSVCHCVERYSVHFLLKC